MTPAEVQLWVKGYYSREDDIGELLSRFVAPLMNAHGLKRTIKATDLFKRRKLDPPKILTAEEIAAIEDSRRTEFALIAANIPKPKPRAHRQ